MHKRRTNRNFSVTVLTFILKEEDSNILDVVARMQCGMRLATVELKISLMFADCTRCSQKITLRK